MTCKAYDIGIDRQVGASPLPCRQRLGPDDKNIENDKEQGDENCETVVVV